MATNVDWQAKRQQAQEAARATKDWAVTHGKEAKDWAVTHGKEAGAYISATGKEVAGRAVETGRETKEQVVAEWNTSMGLGAVVYNAIFSAGSKFWSLPVISFWATVVVLACAVAILVTCEGAGPALILMVLAVTLSNQIIHNSCDAALMLQVGQAKDNGTTPTLKETWPLLKSVWEPVLGLSVASWAEYVAAFGTAILRGLVYCFQLPFKLCLTPFNVERPPAAVDPSMQLAMALVMATVEKTPARAAVDNAEAYFLTQVGEKPQYQRTLWGILSVTALPMLVAGIILSCFKFLAAGFSLIFVAIALSQLAWNTCSHLLAFANHRFITTGKDDILAPAGVAGNAYVATALPTPSAPTPAAAAQAPATLGAESKEEGYTNLEV